MNQVTEDRLQMIVKSKRGECGLSSGRVDDSLGITGFGFLNRHLSSVICLSTHQAVALEFYAVEAAEEGYCDALGVE